jgi:hypothetical protein
MSIKVKTISVEAHHSVEMMKRYHESLRRIYSIIIAKMLTIDFESVLQMSFKTLNDSTKLDDLISTLLMFETYLRMTDDVLSSTIIQRAIVMRKVMDEVKRLVTIRQMNDALNTRNESSITFIHDLSLNSQVLVFREDNE